MSKKKHQKRRKAEGEAGALYTRAETGLRNLSGRVTVDSVQDVFRSSLQVLSPIASDTYWRDYGLDQRTLDKVPTSKLVELLIDLSPDVSLGLWQWLRLSDAGYEIKAFKPESDTIDEKAQAAIKEFLERLHGPYTAPNTVPCSVVISTLNIGSFLRGGLFAELVLDERGKMPIDIATPDPQTVRFKKIEDKNRGTSWQLGQYQGSKGSGSFVPLDRPTVVYIPIDPIPGSPFGRSLVHPAIFATLFLIGLLHDLRRVVAQQGYPRLDLVIDSEKLLKLMPSSLQGDPVKVKEWVEGTVREIELAYGRLQPDDSYVHMDAVTVNSPVGAATGNNLTGLTGIDGVIKSLEGMASKALKMMPLTMGQTQGSETNGNRQYELQVQGIKAIQHLTEGLLEKLLTIALQVQGISATVQWRFAENRTAELLRDRQAEYLAIRNARMLYDNGSIDADEMAERSGVKHKASAPEPRASLSGSGGQVASINADPGSNRIKSYLKRLPDGTIKVKSIEEVTQERNFAAQALLFTASSIPTGEDIDDAEAAFYLANPDAEDILSAEAVNESIN